MYSHYFVYTDRDKVFIRYQNAREKIRCLLSRHPKKGIEIKKFELKVRRSGSQPSIFVRTFTLFTSHAMLTALAAVFAGQPLPIAWAPM
jgi:hypothetical protein